MQFLESVGFADVHRRYLADHAMDTHEHNTNADTSQRMRLADEAFGRWSRVLLSRAEILDVVLPWHLSEGGGVALVPRTGRTVRQAVQDVRSGGAAMAAQNPVCAAKFDRMATQPLSTVHLTTGPLPHDDYADLTTRDGLFHLDGLHRMVGWELAGRLDGHLVEAFVSGPRVAGDPAMPG